MYFQVVPDFFEERGIADLPPATRFDVEQPPEVQEEPQKLGAIEARREVPKSADLRAVRGLDTSTILEFAEELPEVQGGMGALYLNIDYPEAARKAGIQGRVVLRFVVERNGSVEHVDVVESLHPLCDSAAVRAVRNTSFVPGRQNGHRVRVRMSLPIRFRLVEPGTLRNRVS
jgi:protein TonB